MNRWAISFHYSDQWLHMLEIGLGGPKWQSLTPKCAQILLASHYRQLMRALSEYGILKEPGTHTLREIYKARIVRV